MEFKELKYVIFRDGRPVLVSPLLNHSDVVGPNVCVESAGMCRLWHDTAAGAVKASCFGGSTSLHVSSRNGADSEIIERMLNEPQW